MWSETNKGSELEKKISSYCDDTNDLRWQIKSQSKRVGNLGRKFQGLEDSWEDRMDKFSLETIIGDATNIEQLFHNNNAGAIKHRVV